MDKVICAKAGCTNDGTKAFKGRPDILYCQGCFDYLRKKIARWNAQMRATRAARRAEAEDNRPARIQAEM